MYTINVRGAERHQIHLHRHLEEADEQAQGQLKLTALRENDEGRPKHDLEHHLHGLEVVRAFAVGVKQNLQELARITFGPLTPIEIIVAVVAAFIIVVVR